MGRRWSRASRVYAVASLACAALAGASANAFLGRAAAASGLDGPPVPVVVARSAIARGGDRADRPARVVRACRRRSRRPAPLGRVSQAAGRVALAALAPGEVVTDTRLARVREGPVASLTPEGLRAFAVPTPLPRGAVAAGDHVDVLATYTSGQPHTEVAASDVEVLPVLGPPSGIRRARRALRRDGRRRRPRACWSSLVSPDQEEQLASATAFATLSIAVV